MGLPARSAFLLSALLCAAQAGASPPHLPYEIDALIDEGGRFDPAADEGSLTILGVTVNGRDLGDSTLLAVRNGEPLVPVDDLRRWRLHVAAGGMIDLDGQRFAPLTSIAGLRFRVDQTRQMLLLDAPIDAFERTALSAGVAAPETSPAAGAAFLNYDLSFERASDKVIAGGYVEMGVSGAAGQISNTLLVSSSRGGGGVVRLDTTATRDDPGGLTRLSLGDALTRGSSWISPTRFGGLRWGTDFSLQPGFLSFPTPGFGGSAALPSNVEVYINNVLRYQTQVDQGPFVLNQLPLIAGSGQVTLRVNDALGVQRPVQVDYYMSTRLLRAGLSDYSVELGAERRGYGFRSFDYGRAFAAGTFRHGATNWLTVESRIELARDLQMIGGALALTVGRLGEVGVAASGSNGPDGFGTLYRVYASRVSPLWSLSVNYQSSTRDFVQLGLVGQGQRPRSQWQVVGGVTLGRWGSVNASQSRIERADGATSNVSTVNYVRRLGRLANLSAFLISARSTGVPDATTVGVTFSRSLGGGASFYAQADSDGRRIELQKPLPSDRGFGYRLVAGEGARDQVQGELNYRGSAIDLSAQAIRTDGDTGVRLLASGGLLMVDDSVFATRRLDSGFAVVDVGGQAGVRVFQDNREVTRTNGQGVAIVTQLRPYETNRIGVAPDDLHLDTAIRNDSVTVVPRFLGGVRATFSVGRGAAGTVVVLLPGGEPLEPGTTIAIEGKEATTFAGLEGEVFIEELTGGMVLIAERPAGRCRIILPAQLPSEVLPRIGPLPCLEADR